MGKRLPQGALCVLRIFDGETSGPATSRVPCKIDRLQVYSELRIAFLGHLLPSDLPQNDHDHFDRQLVFHQSCNFAHQHGQSTVTDDAHDLASGISYRGSDAVRQAVRHCCQRTRKRELHPIADLDAARRPSCDRATVRTNNRIGIKQLIKLIGDDLWLHRHIAPRAPFFHELVLGTC